MMVSPADTLPSQRGFAGCSQNDGGAGSASQRIGEKRAGILGRVERAWASIRSSGLQAAEGQAGVLPRTGRARAVGRSTTGHTR